MPSPRNTKSPVAGHAIEIFLVSEKSITSYNLPDPDIFAVDAVSDSTIFAVLSVTETV